MIALYYCYTPKPLSVSEHMTFQERLCEEHLLKGRVRVSIEGINGVLSGKLESLKNYEDDLRRHLYDRYCDSEPLTLELDIKYCHPRLDLPLEVQLFDSLSVAQTREVVSLNVLSDKGPQKEGGCTDLNGRRKNRRRRRARRQKYALEKQPGGSDYDDDDPQQDPQTLGSFSVSLPTSSTTAAMSHQSLFHKDALHLSPQEWHEKLSMDDQAVLVDVRNSYESKIGFFRSPLPRVPTFLTNTRKYATVVDVLRARASELSGKNVYMYCTGGVRCERLTRRLDLGDRHDPPANIYQLSGGIQRYLEVYGTLPGDDSYDAAGTSSPPSSCFYHGKNFVFNPRRTDARVGSTVDKVGKCVVCESSHDDYDNGHAPIEGREARCVNCRVLVLVCNVCRVTRVRCWGEPEENNTSKENLYCGLPDHNCCIHEGNRVEHSRFLIDDDRA